MLQVGQLDYSGNGRKIEPVLNLECPVLRSGRDGRNKETIHKLKEDPHAQVLFDTCVEDADLGRMTPPTLAEECRGEVRSLSPRFAVVQGATCSFVAKLIRSMTCASTCM